MLALSRISITFAKSAGMLTEEEKKFLAYWKENRDKEKKWTRQLMLGLPLGLVFALPILINYASGWYKRADMLVLQFNPVILIVAVLIIAVFVAIFNKKLKWDRNEQFYLELKAREEKEASGAD